MNFILQFCFLDNLKLYFLLDATIFTTIDEQKRNNNELCILLRKIELLKIKLSHKLPSMQNYLLSKTFAFDNSNSHYLEQIWFIALTFFGSVLSRVNYNCTHFFSLASQLTRKLPSCIQSFMFFSLDCNTDSTLKSTHSVDC